MDWLNDAKNAIYALIGALFCHRSACLEKTEGRVDALEAMESNKASKGRTERVVQARRCQGGRAGNGRQRDNISKIFDRLDEYSRRGGGRHREILMALHNGLAGKADK